MHCDFPVHCFTFQKRSIVKDQCGVLVNLMVRWGGFAPLLLQTSDITPRENDAGLLQD